MNSGTKSGLNTIMLRVCLALLPGVAALTYVWGWGILANLALSIACCLSVEALILSLRRMPTLPALSDGSALVTALLIAVCLPPHTSAFVILTSSLIAIGLVKHAYGGLGRNIFNPAMAGYAAILVAFPEALSHWPAVDGVDGLTGATLLTEFRYRTGLTSLEFSSLYEQAMSSQELIGLAFLAGGALLVKTKIIHWRIPAAVFVGLAIGALFGYDQGSSTGAGGWYFHLITGGTVIAAFFIATDPVTMPAQHNHQWVLGILIGILIYLIRTYGAYPDGIAFAVLLANCATPLLDRRERTQDKLIASEVTRD